MLGKQTIDNTIDNTIDITMNRIATSILAAVAAIAATAQTADIVVSYDSQLRNWETDSLTTTKMTLLANANEAKYFNDISLWADSLSATPEGKKQYQQIIMAACMTQMPDGSISIDLRKGPVKKVDTYVFSNLGDGNLRYYSMFGDEQLYYDEPLDEMQWSIGDSLQNIMGFECILAETDYHGRHWEAWFTPDIPVSFGPWKLRGLPGLILKASAETGFVFTATGIEKTDRKLSAMYSAENYQKADRKKALAQHEHFLNNREAYLSARLNGSVKFEYNISDRPKFNAAKYAIEPDYAD